MGIDLSPLTRRVLHFHNDVKDGGNQEGGLSVEWGDLVREREGVTTRLGGRGRS